MKLVKHILNIIVFIVTFCIVASITWVTGVVVNGPGNIENIQLGFQIKTADVLDGTTTKNYEVEISYKDAFTFWGDDLKASIKKDPKYISRAWFNNDFLDNSLFYWIDTGLTWVAGATVPIFAPMYEISQMATYRQYKICTDSNFSYLYRVVDQNYINTYLNTSDLSDCYTVVEGEYRLYSHGLSENTNNGISYYYYYGDEIARSASNGDYNLKDTISSYDKYQNEIQKYNKYQDPVYDKYMYKFVESSTHIDADNKDLVFDSFVTKADGTYSVKSLSAFLYFQFLLIFVLSIYFTNQNKVIITRTDDGENEIHGSFFHKISKHHLFGHKKNKKIKKNDKSTYKVGE